MTRYFGQSVAVGLWGVSRRRPTAWRNDGRVEMSEEKWNERHQITDKTS